MKVFYICDRTKCENCNPDCKHTDDVSHAAHFKSNEELGFNDDRHDFWEDEDDRP